MYSVFTSDLENTVHTTEKTRVWLWSSTCVENSKYTVDGENIESWLTWIRKSGVKDVYFHNLKYDAQMIIYHLFKLGWEHEDIAGKGSKTFGTLITDNNVFYKLTLNFSKKNVVNIFDSYKKLPFKVDRIAKAFGTRVLKGVIDYKKTREENYKATDDEIEYAHGDTEIMAEALNTQFSQGLERMTIGSDALNEFIKLFGGKKRYRDFFPILDKAVPHKDYEPGERYNKLKPKHGEWSSITEDDFGRNSYKGGIVMVVNENNHKLNKETHGLTYDVNSLYPSVMLDYKYPYGEGEYYRGNYIYDRKKPLYIHHFKAEFIIKANHLPTIQIKKNSMFSDNEYIRDSKGVQELYLTSVDYDLFLEHYDVLQIEHIDGYKYYSHKGFFDKYINKWSEIKKNSTGAIRELAKLMLNNLYGKFAQRKVNIQKIPWYNEDKDIVCYRAKHGEDMITQYIPIGTFITSYARRFLIESAQANYDRVLYMDTDSLHLLGWYPPKNVTYHKSNFSCWDLETIWIGAKFLRQKTYMEYDWLADKWIIKCAGMQEHLKKEVTYENFEVGLELFGKLTPKQIPGGCILTETTFKIKGVKEK